MPHATDRDFGPERKWLERPTGEDVRHRLSGTALRGGGVALWQRKLVSCRLMYEPTSPQLAVVKSRLSEECWAARVEAARQEGKVLAEVVRRVEGGTGLNEAIRGVVPP